MELDARPLLSVVVPTYNRRDLLPAAVMSVLDQASDRVEVVVVDDGSDDGTDEWLKSLPDRRVAAVFQQNAGVSAARNAGVIAARADFIAFLDSDDHAMPGWVDHLLASAESGVDIASCAAEFVERSLTRSIVAPHQLGPLCGGLHALPLAGCYGIRRDRFLAVGGFKSDLRFGENTLLFIRLGRLHLERPLKVSSTGAPLVSIRRRVAQYDARRSYETPLLAMHDAPDMFERDAHARSVYLGMAGVAASRLGMRRQAISLLLRAWRAKPTDPRNAARVVVALLPQEARRLLRLEGAGSEA